ncbi:tyrosine recombinase XerC [Methylicorpusculum oleiharenae]|nr:tyrosine recombinase XerC [Methylicorpusculum oleiharenae]
MTDVTPAATQWLERFIEQLQIEKRSSPHTVTSYRHDLLKLTAYCEEHNIQDWQDIQPALIRGYIAARHRQGMGSKSLQRELSSIRGFFKFLLKLQVASINPAQAIRAPKQDRKLPKLLDVDQVSGLLDANTVSALEIRDQAMFELFYSCGLRLSELTDLNINDLDLSDRTLIVRSGKGNKTRVLPIGSKAVKSVNSWLMLRPQYNAGDETALFISNRGKRISTRNVHQRLQNWCQTKGVAEHVHPHMLRHSFASHLLESSQDLRAVQELLGHANISTTQIYTHLNFQHLADVYDQTHPRAKKRTE